MGSGTGPTSRLLIGSYSGSIGKILAVDGVGEVKSEAGRVSWSWPRGLAILQAKISTLLWPFLHHAHLQRVFPPKMGLIISKHRPSHSRCQTQDPCPSITTITPPATPAVPIPPLDPTYDPVSDLLLTPPSSVPSKVTLRFISQKSKCSIPCLRSDLHSQCRSYSGTHRSSPASFPGYSQSQ